MAEDKATETETRIVRANMNRQLVTGAGFSDVYANDTQVQMTPWDVRLMFGVIKDVDIQPDGKVTATIERLVDVRMSLQHAKKIARILAEQIKSHEAKIGPIAIPED